MTVLNEYVDNSLLEHINFLSLQSLTKCPYKWHLYMLSVYNSVNYKNKTKQCHGNFKSRSCDGADRPLQIRHKQLPRL